MAEHPFDVIDCEQRTPEWVAARIGRITATDAQAMLAKPRKGAPESLQRRDLRVRLALERLTGRSAEDSNGWGGSADMRRGIEREAEALAAYEARTGDLVQQVGFLSHRELPIGNSPDGIVGDWAGGLELKAPKAATHYEYLRAGNEVPSEYRPQILHSLFVSRLPFWDWASYQPDFPEPLRLHVVRTRLEDVDLAAYGLVVNLFLSEVDLEHGRIAELLKQCEVSAEAAF